MGQASLQLKRLLRCLEEADAEGTDPRDEKK